MDTKTKKAILDFLNEIAPDTYDEGEYSKWEFTDVSQKGDTYTVYFENEHYEANGYRESSSVTFATSAPPVDENEDPLVNLEWIEVLDKAILEWENP